MLVKGGKGPWRLQFEMILDVEPKETDRLGISIKYVVEVGMSIN
jgi:hypothetical protein